MYNMSAEAITAAVVEHFSYILSSKKTKKPHPTRLWKV